MVEAAMQTTKGAGKRQNEMTGTGDESAEESTAIKRPRAACEYDRSPNHTASASADGTMYDETDGSNIPSSAPPGKRLLPHVVDALALTNPYGIWLSIPVIHSAETLVFKDITYAQLANAVNRASWWINARVMAFMADSIGFVDQTAPQTIAYLGPTDSRYLLLLIAAVKAGHRLLLPSTRNADVAQRKLLETSRCRLVFCAESEVRRIDAMLTSGCESEWGGPKVSTFVVPSQTELLSDVSVPEFVYRATYEEEKRKTSVVLHTSGTGGDPSPIELPHAYYAYEDMHSETFTREGVLTFAPLKPGVRCLYTGPLYHAGAVLFTLMKSLFLQATMVILPPNEPVTAEVVQRCIVHGRATMLGTAPSVLEELCATPERMNCLKSLTDIFCGSGPMPKSVGEAVKSIDVNLHHIYGSTETGLMPENPLDDPQSDWQYFRFHPASGIAFVPVGKDGLYELIVRRNQKVTQPCFEIFSDLQEYHTHDTFSEHPIKTGLWRFEGRMDDIITLTNGEKFCPSKMEELIADHAAIEEVMVVGQGRFQPALIVHMSEGSCTANDALADVWPVIQLANEQMPGYAHIGRHLVFLTSMPFAKTPKGTLRRHLTETMLRTEIDFLYAEAAECRGTQPIVDLRCSRTIEKFLHAVLPDKPAPEQRLSSVTDPFAHGLDSLKVAELVSLINASLRHSAAEMNRQATRVSPAFFYQHSSIASLKAALLDLHNGLDTAATTDEHWKEDRRFLLEKYGKAMPRQTLSLPLLDVVMLTGSTGSLGTHILHVLLQREDIEHVYCLDRSDGGKATYLKTFPDDIQAIAKATFLSTASLAAERLGVVRRIDYAHLMSDVSTIIHNAWPVNFDIPLCQLQGHGNESASFETHIAGVRRLIDFAASAVRHPQLVFISGLAAVLNYGKSNLGSIPEQIVHDTSAPLGNGYGRSKWLAEQILNCAAATSHLLRVPKIIRIGQIAGPRPGIGTEQSRGGTWSINELIPSIIRTSATIKALPSYLHAMEKLRWIPVDCVAKIVLDISSHEGEYELKSHREARVYNVTTDHSCRQSELTWKIDMLPRILLRLESQTKSKIDVVPMKAWLSHVESNGTGVDSNSADRYTDNPAFKLLEVCKDLLETDKGSGLGGDIDISGAEGASRAMRELGHIDLEWMESWMAGWGI